MTSSQISSGSRHWNATQKELIVILQRLRIFFIFYMGSLQDFYCKKGTHVSLYVACLHFNVEIIKMRQYLTNILKCDTSSDFTKEKIDQWLDSFKKLQKKYIITPKESYNYSFHEESRFILVRSPPCFMDQENETIFQFNHSTVILKYSF